MSAADSVIAASGLLGWIAQALVFGTVLAGLTWVVTRVLGERVSPALLAGLWSLVLVKFVLPIGPEWSFSLPSMIERAVVGSRAGLIASMSVEQPVEVTPLAADRTSADPGGTSRQPWWPVPVALAYLCLVAMLASQRLLRNHRYISHCRRLPCANREVEALVRRVCRRLGVRRFPLVRLSEELPAPLITGVLTPVLVLSRHQLSRPDELETVVVHEITHLRRGDLAVRCLQWTAAALFFFWPVVAWINRRIDAAREHACDQWALRHGKLSAGAYARCLLRAASSVGASPMLRWSTCMAGSVSSLERRIDMILTSTGRRASSPAGQVLVAALFIGWSVFALTGATGVEAGPSSHESITDQTLEDHAARVVARIARYPSADVDSDGEISFAERNAFLVTVVLSDTQQYLSSFPYSDPFQGRELDVMEAYDVVRGLSYRSKVEHKVKLKLVDGKEKGLDGHELEQLKKDGYLAQLEATQVVLDAQDALLDRIAAEPPADKVAAVHEKIDKNRQYEEQLKIEKKTKTILMKAEELEKQGRTEEAAELRDKAEKLEQMIKQKKTKK
jgi:beta-lactamase regulating signal transducer with metallopeptidase domain